MSGRAETPDKATLQRLYAGEGLTIAALALRFEVAPQTAHKWLIASGVARRPPPSAARGDVSAEDVRRLYVDEGATAAQIGSQLGCSTSLVYARLSSLGVARRPPGQRHHRRPGDGELRRLYDGSDLSLRQIARRHDATPQAVRAWLREAGVARCPAPATAAVGTQETVALYQAGWTGPQIARRLGCSTATVYRRLDDAGLPRGPSASVSRAELVDGLERGLTAPQIAAALSVSVSAVCRALTREAQTTAGQAAKGERARWRAGLLQRISGK